MRDPEAELRALARRFADAERRVRALLRRGPEGDRRTLLAAALAILLDLRREAQGAGLHVERAYALAAQAVAQGPAPVPDAARVRRLGAGLAAKLDRAAMQAEQGARNAFGRATAENLPEAEAEAVTARIDAAGRRRLLGAEAEMLTRTIGRHAVTRATFDTLPADASVLLSGGSCPICEPLQGVYAAAACPQPPFHPSCDCSVGTV